MNTQIDKSLTANIQKDKPLSPLASKIDKVTAVARTKAEMDVAIMQSAKVRIGTKNESLTLLFNTAIDKINEQLESSLGENAIQKGMDESLDISPEATAERIVRLATRSFQPFMANQNNQDNERGLNHFMDLIAMGVDRGFDEARGILKGLDVLKGDIVSNIDKTYVLIQDKLSAFNVLMSEQVATQPERKEKYPL